MVGASSGSRRTEPARTCVACRRVRPKRELTRIVRQPDGSVMLDHGGRANGRGAYLCEADECRARAVDGGVLARALATTIPLDVERALRADVR